MAAAEALASKYAALENLRRSRQAYMRRGLYRLEGKAKFRRHKTLLVLCHDFPGCLRELDWLTDRALARRLAQAQRVALGACAPRWLAVVWDYHALLHSALAWRRWCRVPEVRACLSVEPSATLVRRFACWYEGAGMAGIAKTKTKTTGQAEGTAAVEVDADADADADAKIRAEEKKSSWRHAIKHRQLMDDWKDPHAVALLTGRIARPVPLLPVVQDLLLQRHRLPQEALAAALWGDFTTVPDLESNLCLNG